jgi:spore maturation protein CgeB
MRRSLRIAYIAHSVSSDWNNGNAHFLRGLMRSMVALGHDVTIYEQALGWSLENLLTEQVGQHSRTQFANAYPELNIYAYAENHELDPNYWKSQFQDVEIVIVHEWNSAHLAHCIASVRDELGFKLLFHDTHHRASSSPEEMARYGISNFDGVLAFGEALRSLYLHRYGVSRAWTLHEAADISVFHPISSIDRSGDVVWIGNWGDDERSREICEFLLCPASQLPHRSFALWGVRYPQDALEQLARSRVAYRGYLPNLQAPRAYAASRLTVHIPRQQYTACMDGIPTIRVFEALACGIPLISAPWRDSEQLFREGDFTVVRNGSEMRRTLEHLLEHPREAEEQALRGLETVLSRHTCRHRAEQLTSICEEMIA